MSREYIVKLSKKEKDALMYSANMCLGDGEWKALDSAYQKLEQARRKPYTNFDKIKEMKIFDFALATINSCSDIASKIGTPIPNISYREWLESEVKE